MNPHTSAAAGRFTACWQEDSPRVAAYARRHVGADRSADVVAETFTTAWRRWPELPDPPLPWLIATARRIMANERRAVRRRQALDHRMRLLSDVAAPVVEDSITTAFQRTDALRHLAGLSEDHREALLLLAWDGLSIAEAASVLGIKPTALRARLHRARKALEALQRADEIHETPTPEPRLQLKETR